MSQGKTVEELIESRRRIEETPPTSAEGAWHQENAVREANIQIYICHGEEMHRRAQGDARGYYGNLGMRPPCQFFPPIT